MLFAPGYECWTSASSRWNQAHMHWYRAILVPEARSLSMEIPEVRRSWSRCLHLRLFLRCWQSCVDSMARDLHHRWLSMEMWSMFDVWWCMQHVQLRMETIPTFEIPRSARYEEIVKLSCFEYPWFPWTNHRHNVALTFTIPPCQVVPSVDSVRLVYAFQRLGSQKKGHFLTNWSTHFARGASIQYTLYKIAYKHNLYIYRSRMISSWLKVVPLFAILKSRILITHDKHVLCPGPTGTGKSPLVLSLFEQNAVLEDTAIFRQS